MAAPAGKPDNRKQKRVRRKHRVLLNAEGHRIKGTTADLSAGGMLVNCAHALTPGTKLSGEIFLNEDEGLPFEAQVRWNRNSTRWLTTDIQHSIGLQFTKDPGSAYQEYVQAPPKASTLSVAEVRANTKPPPMRPNSGTFPGAKFPPPEPAAPPAPPTPVRRRPSIPAMMTPPPTPVLTPTQTPAPVPRPPPIPVLGLDSTDVGVPLVAPPEPVLFQATVPGLEGVAHGSASSTHKKGTGLSPLAPSAAAALIERAAVKAVAATLPEGFRTVGLAIDLELRKPPVVTLGEELEARVKLVRLQPDRTLIFSCEVRQGDRLIASGQHQRLIVEVES